MLNQIDKPSFIINNAKKCNILINSNIGVLSQNFGSNDKILIDFFNNRENEILKRENNFLRSQLESIQKLVDKLIKIENE